MNTQPFKPRTGIAALVLALVTASPGMPAQEQAAPATQPAPPTQPNAQSPGATPEDGPAYQVSAFQFRYVRDNSAHPPIEHLMNLEVDLGWTYQGYVAPRPGLPVVRIAPAHAVNRGTETYYASALQRILERVRDQLLRQQLIGVYVAPDPTQISDVGQDYRAPDQTGLTIVITTGVVTDLRTLASGERVGENRPIKPEDRINHPLHDRIRVRSPIQPFCEGDTVHRDLLRKDLLDEYLFFLSRHPGRRVDASVAAADEPGGVILDYQVTENKPLTLYVQGSNTGTRSTGYWRERFGFFHTQLTNNDDILSFDYITAGFDDTNAVLGAYEAPFENDRVRWRVHGHWSEFIAEEVGFFDDDFEGESWAVGGEIIANIFQQRELFIDAVGGARYENIEVDNRGFGIRGEEDFVIPHIALRLDRTTEWFSTQASVGLEFWLGGGDEDELAALGRTDPDSDATILQWSLSHAVYLEPLIDRAAWEDPSTPEDSTLAHEVLGILRGQYAFENRLIPQAEQVVGGLYSVRGYPESIVAGDTVIIGTLEYRYHVPRAFGVEPEPRELFGQPFRTAPQYVYGRPDWDLVLKAFVDAGRTYNSDRLSFERDETLLGVGVGIEFLFKRNLNVRLDWGFALEELEAGPVNEGSNRLHFVGTLLF